MQYQRQSTPIVAPCGCAGWLADAERTIPACVCPSIARLANAIYWELPNSRRGVFAELEPAMCGTATYDADEVAQRLMMVAEAAVRLSGQQLAHSTLVPWLLDGISEWRGCSTAEQLAKIDRCAEVVADSAADNPVSAWLALDTLTDLIVRATK